MRAVARNCTSPPSGVRASQQAGGFGEIAALLDLFGRFDAKSLLETERDLLTVRIVKEQIGGESAGEK